MPELVQPLKEMEEKEKLTVEVLVRPDAASSANK